MRTAREVVLDALGQEGFFKGERTAQLVDAISAALSAADYIVVQRDSIAALANAGDKALHAIDLIISSHEGQSEHSDLKAAFDALETALNKHFEERAGMAHVVEKTGTAAADTSGANPDRDATKTSPAACIPHGKHIENAATRRKLALEISELVHAATGRLVEQIIEELYVSDIRPLRRERDAMRRCVGDIEYYFRRWSGILSEERDWLMLRINQANAEAEGRKP